MNRLIIAITGIMLETTTAFGASQEKPWQAIPGPSSPPFVLAYNQYGQTPNVSLSHRVFIFDPRQHHWLAYENGHLVGSGRAAGGASYCRDLHRSCRTPVGVFHVVRKGPANCHSSIYPKPYGGARMDYCMFFSKYYAVHGSSSVPPANVSHGCVRVPPNDARWLSGNFMRVGTTVIVKPY